MSDLVVRINTDNPDPRTACALCLDRSYSMLGEPIAELNKGLRTFAQDAKADDIARRRVEVEVVSFGGTARVESPFREIRDFEPPELTADGNTPMADAIALAVDGLELRKKAYRAAGLEYQRPWLVLMTDGIPTDSPRYFDETVAHLNDIERRRGVTVFPIAIGENADMTVLARISVEREPVRMQDVASFSKFFVWLAASLSVTSQSGAGQKRLPPLTGWASV